MFVWLQKGLLESSSRVDPVDCEGVIDEKEFYPTVLFSRSPSNQTRVSSLTRAALRQIKAKDN